MQPRSFSCKLISLLVPGAIACMPLVLKADVVILKSGAKLECEVIGYSAGKLTLRKPDGKIVTGLISTVAEIQFSRPMQTPVTAAGEPPAPPAAESPEESPMTIPVATAPDAPPEAPPDAAETNAPPAEVEPPKPPKPVHEYTDVSDVLRALPAELQPHKEAWKKNPLMRTQMEDWFKENAVGSHLSLPRREILAIDTGGWLTVDLREFSVGTVKYKCPSGIKCQYWSEIPSDPAKYLKLLKDLEAEGKQLTDYYAVKNKEKDEVNARLSKLKVGKRDEKGRVIRRGSHVAVSGVIKNFGVMTFMDATPPHVRVDVELVEAKIEE